MGEHKVIYERGAWTVRAWVERHTSYDGEASVSAYVSVERAGQHVKTWWARTAPARWWEFWERKRELPTVVSEAIAFIDEQQDLETTAEATLEAVTEAMRLTT